jgi:N-acetylmuramoyl-L-alanine amidase
VRVYREGDEGPEILDIQQRLNAAGIGVGAEPGRYGPATTEAVRMFQERRNLPVDGLVGPDTWGQLVEAGFRPGDRTLYLHAPPMRGDDVRALQRKLNALGFDAGKQDGVHGPATDGAVREFQRNVGEVPDGVVGLHTFEMIERMRPIEEAQSRALVREAEELRQMRSALPGQTVAVDPGEAPGEGEPDAGLALALALADVLTAAGAKPVLLRSAEEDPSPGDRARIANEMGAALCIAMHLAPGGWACAYFGSAATHSPGGERLASAIAEEVAHGMGARATLERLTVSILRETRMPAVQVTADPGADVDRVAIAIATGVERFFGADAP